LSDIPVNNACQIIKAQFPYLRGLQSMLLQLKKSAIILKEQVKVIHDRGDHWIVASNMGCKPKEVNFTIQSSVQFIKKHNRLFVICSMLAHW